MLTLDIMKTRQIKFKKKKNSNFLYWWSVSCFSKVNKNLISKLPKHNSS
jgi:hypothetical protein